MRHGLDVGVYRARSKLSPDHPVGAPAYLQRRSTLAKEPGLGRRPVPVAAEPANANINAAVFAAADES